MSARIKTTLRLPGELHARFVDDGSMNAEIIGRLERSFMDEWRGVEMPASDLLNALALPDVVRLKPGVNPHDDIMRLCHLVSGLSPDAIVLGVNKSRRLIAIIQLKNMTILADTLSFTLDSAGRAHDLQKLVGCLDAYGLLKTVKAMTGSANDTHDKTPHAALDQLAQNPVKSGLKALRDLFQMMNNSLDVDV